jgi:L-asparaginase II
VNGALPLPPVTVAVTRGGVVECRHRVHVAVADARGRLVAAAGDPGLVTFLRSAAKPIQALALVESGAADDLGCTGRHLAVACASHHGMEMHVQVVRELLGRAGLGPEHLRCGPHAPADPEAAEALRRAGAVPERIHNNCSGKHAGMLAVCVHRGWAPDGYLDPHHPVQCEIRATLEALAGQAVAASAPDGCGVPTFALPLRAMAVAYARLGCGYGLPGVRAVAAARLAEAMAAHPELVSGPGSLNTELLRRHGQRVLTKGGAEGVWCYAVRQQGPGLGLALKVEDGAARAVGPALLAVLKALGLPGGGDPELASFTRPIVRNTLGEAVGEIRAEVPAAFASAGPASAGTA